MYIHASVAIVSHKSYSPKVKHKSDLLWSSMASKVINHTYKKILFIFSAIIIFCSNWMINKEYVKILKKLPPSKNVFIE